MKLSKIASQVIKENDVKVDSLSQEFELSEPALDSLRDSVNKLNIKATKWRVPPLKIEVVSERGEKKVETSAWGDEDVIGITKFYTIKLIGDVPRVDGFEFVGKIEHTPTGENILNIAPGSPIKNLPEIYKTVKGECDVCKSNRERFNTFILQLEKDTDRFPDKKSGDLIQVGSGCLKRFLPNIDVNVLVNYAKMLVGIRSIKDSEPKDTSNERNGPDAYKNHIPTDTLLKYVVLAYVGVGKFISKKKADFDNGEVPTSEEALSMMFNPKREENYIIQRIKNNPTILQHAKELEQKVKSWMESTNFNDFSKNNPDFANYYHNVNILSKSPTIQVRNVGYFASILSLYLRHHKVDSDKKEDSEKTFVGKVGGRINFHGKLLGMKSFPSEYGRGNVVLYKFEDLDGNRLEWWSSVDTGFIQGETYSLSGLVKNHKIDNYSKLPTTVIKNVKINKM